MFYNQFPAFEIHTIGFCKITSVLKCRSEDYEAEQVAVPALKSNLFYFHCTSNHVLKENNMRKVLYLNLPCSTVVSYRENKFIAFWPIYAIEDWIYYWNKTRIKQFKYHICNLLKDVDNLARSWSVHRWFWSPN